MKRSTLVFLLILALLVVGVIYASTYAQKKFKVEEKQMAKVQEVPVTVVKIERGNVDDVIDLTGFIEPDDQVSLIAKLSVPGKLIKNLVEEGEKVRKNQVLAYVDRDEVGARYAPYPVKSPIEGIVAQIASDKGSLVTAQLPVGVVINIDKVKVQTSIIEQEYGKIRPELVAYVTTEAFPGRIFEGKITKITPTLDQYSHTAGIEITLPNEEHTLRPGMFASIGIVTDTKHGVPVIPKRAVVKRKGKNMVFKVKDGIVNIQTVRLGYYDRKNYEVLEGAEPGDLIVLNEQAVLQDGIKVQISKQVSNAPKQAKVLDTNPQNNLTLQAEPVSPGE